MVNMANLNIPILNLDGIIINLNEVLYIVKARRIKTEFSLNIVFKNTHEKSLLFCNEQDRDEVYKGLVKRLYGGDYKIGI